MSRQLERQMRRRAERVVRRAQRAAGAGRLYMLSTGHDDDCPECRRTAELGDPATRIVSTLPDGTRIDLVALRDVGGAS